MIKYLQWRSSVHKSQAASPSAGSCAQSKSQYSMSLLLVLVLGLLAASCQASPPRGGGSGGIFRPDYDYLDWATDYQGYNYPGYDYG